MSTLTVPETEESQIRELNELLRLGPPELVGPNGTDRMALPPSIYRLLRDILDNMSRGKTIALMPGDEALTTQSAANYLGISRPFLVKLLDEGKIPHHKTGSHRRIRFADIAAYAHKRDSERRTILDEMTREADDQIGGIPEGGQDE